MTKSRLDKWSWDLVIASARLLTVALVVIVIMLMAYAMAVFYSKSVSPSFADAEAHKLIVIEKAKRYGRALESVPDEDILRGDDGDTD